MQFKKVIPKFMFKICKIENGVLLAFRFKKINFYFKILITDHKNKSKFNPIQFKSKNQMENLVYYLSLMEQI